ncbi:MAG: helix-turn-helix transcriptional regulator [Thermoanaerobaculia bacterium]|nr:helix-turn-helix transcriptional regulator [Myxococcota bacterium]MCK6682669.1 helix-turn-helix transcriptional regulator [Thermoanaerobaculia bacterium]
MHALPPREALSIPDFSLHRLNGDRLRRARLDSGLSQASLASSLGVSPATISRLESGEIAEDADRDRRVFAALCSLITSGSLAGAPEEYVEQRPTRLFKTARELRALFFADAIDELAQLRDVLAQAMEMSFSIMDENGSLLHGRPHEGILVWETRRVMRLRVCQTLRSTITPTSRFRLVENSPSDTLNIHPCNLHDANLIRCAFALGHPAFSRCPTGFLSVIVPFRGSDFLSLPQAGIDIHQQTALGLVDFLFVVPCAQVSYSPPIASTLSNLTDSLRFFMETTGVGRPILSLLTEDRIARIQDEVRDQQILRMMQQRSLETFLHFMHGRLAEPPRWGAFYSEAVAPSALENWVDYQLRVLLMRDPLLGPEITAEHADSLVAVAQDDSQLAADEIDSKLDFSVKWLALKHGLSPRDILVAGLWDFPRNKNRRAAFGSLDQLRFTIRLVRAHVQTTLGARFSTWLMSAAKHEQVLQPLLSLLR